jgi:ribosomal protein S12 methylthiotransferase
LSALRFHIVSLGCAKNTVDSQSMTELLTRAGYQASPIADEADVLIVNTCGFIQPAREESYLTLNELGASKRPDQLLIAAGCLPQYLGSQIASEVPGLDAVLGTRRWMDIVAVLQKLRLESPPAPLFHLPDTPTVGTDEHGVLRAAVQGASAYLKIADGCHRPCAFCSIPSIKGPTVSRPMQRILTEARHLQDLGVRELILIAQDTTAYGHDLGLHDGLPDLLAELVREVPRIEWIRILYAYPGSVSQRMIDAMAQHDQILPYLDMPLQHAHPDTLRRMRRPANIEWVNRTLEKMRRTMPDLALRTTFIVGYPGETDAEFQTLCDFVAEVRFDRLGVFAYSFEPGTSAAELGDPVPESLKQERLARLMELQQQISLEKHQQLIGRSLDVLIEGQGDGLSMGRTYRDAPEIDGLVIVEGEVEIGTIASVRIDGAMPYDLTGHPA